MAARSPHKGLSIGTYENDSRQHGKVLLCTVPTFDHAFVCTAYDSLDCCFADFLLNTVNRVHAPYPGSSEKQLNLL